MLASHSNVNGCIFIVYFCRSKKLKDQFTSFICSPERSVSLGIFRKKTAETFKYSKVLEIHKKTKRIFYLFCVVCSCFRLCACGGIFVILFQVFTCLPDGFQFSSPLQICRCYSYQHESQIHFEWYISDRLSYTDTVQTHQGIIRHKDFSQTRNEKQRRHNHLTWIEEQAQFQIPNLREGLKVSVNASVNTKNFPR